MVQFPRLRSAMNRLLVWLRLGECEAATRL